MTRSVNLSGRSLAVVVLIAFMGGLAAKTLFLRDSTATSAPRAVRHEAASVEDVRLEAPGVPIGTERSESGARAAAIAYVQLGDLVLSLDPASASAALERIASRHSSDAFVRTELAGFEQLRNALGRGAGPVRLRVGVVGARIDAFSPRRARVVLWRVAVLSRDGMATAGAQWATVTYDLVWEDASWKVWSESVVPGPAPADTVSRPATPAEMETALTGFEPVGLP